MQSVNKKIKNATQNTLDGIEFKSRLEAMIYKTLKEQGFNPKYEPWKFTIWEGYSPTVPFYDRDSKTGGLKRNITPLAPITYTPDICFEYNNWYVIIEAKGMVNDVFPLKKKLFRKYLETWKKPVVYFEIYSKKQLLEAIETVKIMGKITEIRKLLEYLPTKKDIALANKFLDGRKFAELKELVDADAEKMARKRYRLLANENPYRKEDEVEEEIESLTAEQQRYEMQYDAIKDLQAIVNEQAEPFIEELYDPSLSEIEDYA